jgi:hypothetical protein
MLLGTREPACLLPDLFTGSPQGASARVHAAG